MKIFKSAIAVFMSMIMLMSVVGFGASAQDVAEETNAKELNILCYNVAGLPNWNKLFGKDDGVDVVENQKNIGKMINSSNYDIVAVQEDFFYHRALTKQFKGTFPYKTNHTGGVPGGDGMNIYSRTPIYNEKRTTWDKLYGIIDHGADEMTPKGVLYSVIDLGDGVYVDFYNIHADANGDEGSIEARMDNFRQLTEMIQANNSGRPVIVTGDFNTSVHLGSSRGCINKLMDDCNLKDAWIETNNNGDYKDFSAWYEQYGTSWETSWGVWDSVEKFLYRDGNGVKLTADEFEYIYFKNGEGANLSDHAAASVKFTYEKTEDFTPETQQFKEVRYNPFKVIGSVIKYVCLDLYKIFSNFDELLAYIK